ncbi:MAG: alpha/beta hydrolase [Pseudomonadota bacterium]
MLWCKVYEGDGPPVLLTHGILSSRAQWLPNLQALQQFCSPVVVELLGHHQSPSPEDSEPYHPDSYVRHFESIREALGVERWYVVGQSLGAALTMRYALRCPETIERHIITNSTSAFMDNWPAEQLEGMERSARALEKRGRDALERMPLHPLNAKRVPPDVKQAMIDDATQHNPLGIANTMRHTVANSPILKLAGENRVPTLLLCGEYEKRFIPHKEAAIKHTPMLEVKDLPAGHSVNIGATEEFNAAVQAFFFTGK